MKSNPDKDLLDRIRTREQLEKRGYTRESCPHCHGMGSHTFNETPLCPCLACKGRGYTWKAPLMRCDSVDKQTY